jgi:hypothetical protein
MEMDAKKFGLPANDSGLTKGVSKEVRQTALEVVMAGVRTGSRVFSVHASIPCCGLAGHPRSQLIGVPHRPHRSASTPCSRPQCGQTVPSTLSGSRMLSVSTKMHSDFLSILYSARQSRQFTFPDSLRRLVLAQNGHLLGEIMRPVDTRTTTCVRPSRWRPGNEKARYSSATHRTRMEFRRSLHARRVNSNFSKALREGAGETPHPPAPYYHKVSREDTSWN